MMIIVPYQWQEIIHGETSERQELSLTVINRPLVWRLLAESWAGRPFHCEFRKYNYCFLQSEEQIKYREYTQTGTLEKCLLTVEN